MTPTDQAHLTRRARQLAEIAALREAGDTTRADGLTLEHLTRFPDDVERLAPDLPLP